MAHLDPLIGRQLGSFQIERLIGRGGMAAVYYGLDVHLQRPVAIKVIDERYRADNAYAERFVREARAMAAWRHPNIPQIYQAGQEEGLYFYAMEFIQGLDLARLLEQYARLGELPPHQDVLRIGRAVAEALDYAHQLGAVHRDVKPSNVLVAQDGRILLTDFGLVMQIAQGTMGEVFGSPHYMSPEQARSSAQAVPQSDLYSLGVILYEMLAGALPFHDVSPAALALKHLSLEPPPPRQFNPGLSPEAESVLLKALRKSPGERYQTGSELMKALESALAGDAIVETSLRGEAGPPVTIPILPSSAEPPQERAPASTEAHIPHHTVSKLRVDEMVTRQLEAQPPDTQAFPGPGPRSAAPATPAGRRPLAAVGIGCALLLAALAALPLVIAAFWAFNRPDGSRSAGSPAPGLSSGEATPTSAPLANPYATLTAVALGAGLSTIPTPTEPLPTPNPSATPEPVATQAVVLEILLAMEKDDSLFLVNQSAAGIPLASLQVGNGEGQISGEEWGLDQLEAGQCVSVWKEEGNPKAPKGLECQLVGERLERSGSEKFWTSDFGVYYRDALVGTCEGRKGPCTIRFPLSE